MADTLTGFWRLYESRCHLVQQDALRERGRRLQNIIQARSEIDSGPIEQIKVKQRSARRRDAWLQLQSQVLQRQASLKNLVGSDADFEHVDAGEWIPVAEIEFPVLPLSIRDATRRGIENRPEVRRATESLRAAANDIEVSRNELLPRLDAVIDAYLSGLNGNRDVARSFGDQFSRGGPGLSASLQYNLPISQRLARSKYRTALQRYRQRSEELRESIQLVHTDVETSLIRWHVSQQLIHSKRDTLATAIEEERILTARWKTVGGDGGRAGVVLESVLDAQQRRAEAEQSLVTAYVDQVIALISLQRAMGTLLIDEQIQPSRDSAGDVRFDTTGFVPGVSVSSPTHPPVHSPSGRVGLPEPERERTPRRLPPAISPSPMSLVESGSLEALPADQDGLIQLAPAEGNP
ncbi:MAG: TolC family protein [Planctomycetota bacterium]